MWQPLRHQQAPHVTSSAKQHLMPHWTHQLLVYDQHTAAMQTGACIQCMQLPPRQRLPGSTAVHGHQFVSLEALLSTSLTETDHCRKCPDRYSQMSFPVNHRPGVMACLPQVITANRSDQQCCRSVRWMGRHFSTPTNQQHRQTHS